MAPNHDHPCIGHEEVVRQLTEIKSTLFGSKGDSRGGLVGEHEVIKNDVKSITKNMWIAFGGVMVVNVTIVPILIGLVLWFLTSHDLGGRRSWLNADSAKYFISELTAPSKGRL
jgi:hypothetical protein